MKKVLSIVAVVVLVLTLCVGCDKKDKDGVSSTDKTLGATSIVEGLPSESVGTQTDSSGNVVFVEDTIDADILDNPAAYNQQQNVSASQSSTTTNISSTTSTTEKDNNEDNSSTDLEGTQDTESGYSDGWLLD